MWKTASLLVVGGGAAYSYVLEPMWVNWGFEEARCWWNGGVVIQAGPQERGYVAEMNKMVQNRARLESGLAKGCMPEAKCALEPAKALDMMDRKVLSWALVQEYQRAKLRVYERLHDGKGIDLPGDGVAQRVDALAKLAEADYCVKYLELTRGTLAKAIQPAMPVNDGVRTK